MMEQCLAKYHEAGVDLLICVLGKGHDGLHNDGNVVWMDATEFYDEDSSQDLQAI